MNAIPVFEESVSDSEVLCVCIIHADIMKYRKQRKYYYQSHNQIPLTCACFLNINFARYFIKKWSAHCNIVILQLPAKKEVQPTKINRILDFICHTT